MDGLSESESGVVIIVEVQRKTSEMPPQRSRYILSATDVRLLRTGQEYKVIPDVYLIIFHQENPFKEDIAYDEEIVTLKRTGMPVEKGQHVIHINGEWRGQDAIGDLMRDFAQKSPDNMKYKELAKRVRTIKFEKGGRREMESFVDTVLQRQMDSFIRNWLTTTDLSVQQIANNFETNPDHVMEIKQKLQEQGLCKEQSGSQQER